MIVSSEKQPLQNCHVLDTSLVCWRRLVSPYSNWRPKFSERLNANGVDALYGYRKPYQQKDWKRTGWVVAGNGFDKINGADGYTSRGIKFMEFGNRHTKKLCSDYVSKLKREEAWVSFTHPEEWKIEDCRDSCGAYLIFPESKLAVFASFD